MFIAQRTDSACGMSLVRSDHDLQNDEQEGTLLLFKCHITTQAYSVNALLHVAFKDINTTKYLHHSIVNKGNITNMQTFTSTHSQIICRCHASSPKAL